MGTERKESGLKRLKSRHSQHHQPSALQHEELRGEITVWSRRVTDLEAWALLLRHSGCQRVDLLNLLDRPHGSNGLADGAMNQG